MFSLVCSNGEQPKICDQSCLRADCDLPESPEDAKFRGFPICQADPCNDCKVTFWRKHPWFNPVGTQMKCNGRYT